MPLISILIPVYNEEEHILQCLESVLGFELPKGIKTEILIGDGGSTDETVSLIKRFKEKHPQIILFRNPKKYQSFALNIGIKRSKGDFIMRLDAHSKYPKAYLKECYETSLKQKADNTGGIFITKAGSSSFSALIVQAITTHKFGVGDSSFRTEEKEGKADTVPYGFFKRDIFDRIGYFNEKLYRCQDYEFNRRIQLHGGRVWRNPKIKVIYYNQSSFLSFLKKQLFYEGPFNPYMWYVAPYSLAFRHLITGLFSLGILIGSVLCFFNVFLKFVFLFVLAFYFLLGVFFSVQQSKRFSNLSLIPILPFCFLFFHFTHGIGVLYGILMLLIKKSPVQ